MIEPSIAQKAVSFVKSAAVFVRAGMPVRNKEQIEERLMICNQCVHYDPTAFSGAGKCGICGCNMELKLVMDTERCPLEHWE
jgi:hypothetical protein